MDLKQQTFEEPYPVVDDINNLPNTIDISSSFLGLWYKTTLWNIKNKWEGCRNGDCTESKRDTVEYLVYVFKEEKWGQPEITKGKGGLFGIGRTWTRVTIKRVKCYELYKVTFREYKCYCSWLFQYIFNVVEKKEKIGDICWTVKSYYTDYQGDIEIDPSEVLEAVKKLTSKDKD